jgi:hypothetical protein
MFNQRIEFIPDNKMMLRLYPVIIYCFQEIWVVSFPLTCKTVLSYT